MEFRCSECSVPEKCMKQTARQAIPRSIVIDAIFVDAWSSFLEFMNAGYFSIAMRAYFICSIASETTVTGRLHVPF